MAKKKEIRLSELTEEEKIVGMLSKRISASKETYENEGLDAAMKFLKENE